MSELGEADGIGDAVGFAFLEGSRVFSFWAIWVLATGVTLAAGLGEVLATGVTLAAGLGEVLATGVTLADELGEVLATGVTLADGLGGVSEVSLLQATLPNAKIPDKTSRGAVWVEDFHINICERQGECWDFQVLSLSVDRCQSRLVSKCKSYLGKANLYEVALEH